MFVWTPNFGVSYQFIFVGIKPILPFNRAFWAQCRESSYLWIRMWGWHNVSTRDEIRVEICFCGPWMRKPIFKFMYSWLSTAHSWNTSEYQLSYNIRTTCSKHSVKISIIEKNPYNSQNANFNYHLVDLDDLKIFVVMYKLSSNPLRNSSCISKQIISFGHFRVWFDSKCPSKIGRIFWKETIYAINFESSIFEIYLRFHFSVTIFADSTLTFANWLSYKSRSIRTSTMQSTLNHPVGWTVWRADCAFFTIITSP